MNVATPHHRSISYNCKVRVQSLHVLVHLNDLVTQRNVFFFYGVQPTGLTIRRKQVDFYLSAAKSNY